MSAVLLPILPPLIAALAVLILRRGSAALALAGAEVVGQFFQPHAFGLQLADELCRQVFSGQTEQIADLAAFLLTCRHPSGESTN